MAEFHRKALMCLGLVFSASDVAMAKLSRPHIVFILADDLGWNDISLHSTDPQIPTPNIDSLATLGVELNNYYVNPVCSPTRGSLMTGRSIIHTGGTNVEGLNLTYTLLPEHLKISYNYTTYMVGKWHLGMKAKEYLPSSRGFDFCNMMYYNGVADYWKHFNSDAQDGQTGLDWHMGGVGYGLQPGEDTPLYNYSGQFSCGLMGAAAADYIKQHATSMAGKSPSSEAVEELDRETGQDDASPMFMYLAIQGIHSSNNRWVQSPQAELDKMDSISPHLTCGQYEKTQSANCTKVAMRKSVAGTVLTVDDAVGVVLDALKSTGMWDDTILVFSTDNGGPTDGADNNMANNFPLRGCKGGYYEGGVRGVGFLAGGKNALPHLQSAGAAPKQNKALFHVSDWFPSLLTAASQGLPGAAASSPPQTPHTLALGAGEIPFKDGDGVDSWDALCCSGAAKRTELLHVVNAPGSVFNSQAIRQGNWKLVMDPAQSDCSTSRPGWYPPPGLPYNYTTFTVQCKGRPPATPQQCSNKLPCLFNIADDPCELRNLAEQNPSTVSQLRTRLAHYRKTAVLPWQNFRTPEDPRASPLNHGPSVPISPNPLVPGPDQGPSEYQGVWKPWLTVQEEAHYYPTNYTGPGY